MSLFARYIKALNSILRQKKQVKQSIESKQKDNNKLNEIFQEQKFETNKVGLAALRDVFKKFIASTNDEKEIDAASELTNKVLFEIIDKPNTLSWNLTQIRKDIPDDKLNIIRKHIFYTPELISTQKENREARQEINQNQQIDIQLNEVYQILNRFKENYNDKKLTPLQRHINLVSFICLNTGCRPSEPIFIEYKKINSNEINFSELFKQVKDHRELKSPNRPMIIKDSTDETIGYLDIVQQFFTDKYSIRDKSDEEKARINNLIQRTQNKYVRLVMNGDYTSYDLRKLYIATAYTLYKKKQELANTFIKRVLGHESLETSFNYIKFNVIPDTEINAEIKSISGNLKQLSLNESQLKTEIKEELKNIIHQEFNELPLKSEKQWHFYELEKKYFKDNNRYIPKEEIKRLGINHKVVSAVRKVINKDLRRFYLDITDENIPKLAIPRNKKVSKYRKPENKEEKKQ